MALSRYLFRKAAKLFLVSVLTTILLMVYLSKTNNEEAARETIIMRKAEIRESMRQEKLWELQRTIFINPKRPADLTYNINVTLSEHTALDREIMDSRPKECKTIVYDHSKLSTTTVIIPFYNEALSMLLRTVHSILKRSPPSLLAEIILIDDHSKNEDLHDPLERYIKLLPKVKLIRTKKREGLIRARMIGAHMAKGKVIMFQDAHTENNVGWLEPILDEIRKNRKTIIQPEVDQIEQWTLQYGASSGMVPRGGFSWDLRYTWMLMPDHEKQRLNSKAQAFRTPTLVGCALAADRDYFFEIGAFDEGMNVWGGENIELAYRNWLCHGQVLTHPCSRVAHAFKPFAYSFDGDREKIVQKNQMRIAELWMDDYKKFFYAATWTWSNKHIYFDEEDVRTLAKRMEIKRKFKCRNFDWYMKTIVPEIPTPFVTAQWYGEVASMKSEACWFANADGYVGLSYFCFFHRTLPENIFHIENNGRLMYKHLCVRTEVKTWLLKLTDCANEGDKFDKWELISLSEQWGVPNEVVMKVTFWNAESKKLESLCACQVTNVNSVHMREQMPQILECDMENEFQRWRWTYKFDFSYKYPLG